MLHAFAFRQDLKKLVGGRPCQRTRCAAVPGLPSDPATAFRQAYKDGRLRSRGSVTLDGRSLWRFVTRKTGAGSYQEWLVDPSTRLPLRYRYVDHNQQRGVPFTNRLTIRLIKFDVLPLNADTRKLLQLTPGQRRVCMAAEASGDCADARVSARARSPGPAGRRASSGAQLSLILRRARPRWRLPLGP